MLTEKWKKFNLALTYFSGFIIVFIMALVCYNVAARYFLKSPLMWASDISGYLLVYITFLPAAYLLIIDAHVRVDFIINMLSEEKRRKVSIAASFLGLIYCLTFTYFSSIDLLESIRMGLYFEGGIAILQFPIVMVLPFGFLLLSIQLVIDIIGSCLAKSKK